MSQEVRDKLAGLEGWTWNHKKGRWEKGSIVTTIHPIPDDLNTCAAMWDECAGRYGYRMERYRNAWVAYYDNNDYSDATVGHSGHDAASELRDRWALLGKVLKARGV